MSTGAVEQEASLLALADVVLSVDQVCSHRHSAVHGTRIRMPKTRSGSGAVPARLRQAHASTVNQDCMRPTRGLGAAVPRLRQAPLARRLRAQHRRGAFLFYAVYFVFRHVDSELNTGVVFFRASAGALAVLDEWLGTF